MNSKKSLPGNQVSNTKDLNYFQSVPAVSSVQDLRQIMAAYPKVLDKRIQHTLDHLSIEFIQVSQVVFLASSLEQNRMFALKVNQGGLSIRDQHHFSFPKTKTSSPLFDDHSDVYVSLYFIAKDIGHGLRVNGTINTRDTDTYFINIEQVYFHCARAVARSELWLDKNRKKPEPLNKDNFIKHAPFLLLKTLNHLGKTELSPRGDKSGFVKNLNTNTMLLPERPGNKIATSLRNIIHNPKIELLFLVPFSNKTLNILGRAKVITDQSLLRQCSVNGKVPKLGILIEIESSFLKSDTTIDESQIWSQEKTAKPNITSFSKALSVHINGEGFLGKVTNIIVDVQVKHDMRNLY